MAHSKPLMIPWLRARINSAEFPGVSWTNAEKTEFSVPWKHGLRGDSSNTDVLIFKAWAEVSGNGRVQGDASVWKRNFRSALRVKGFTLVADNKNDDANPHKVFRWPEETTSRAGSQEQNSQNRFHGACIQETHTEQYLDVDAEIFRAVEMQEYAASQDILQECLKGLNIDPEAGGLISAADFLLPLLLLLHLLAAARAASAREPQVLSCEARRFTFSNFSTEGAAAFEPLPEQQHSQNPVAIGGHPLPRQQHDPVMFVGAASETGLPEQPACPPRRAEGGAEDDKQLVACFLDTMNKTKDGDVFRTQFDISVYYRGVQVHKQLVENEAGFCLVHRPGLIAGAVDSSTGLTLVSLPEPAPMLDGMQATLTQRILNTVGDGLEVGVSGHVVYSQRRGETKAFWSFSKFDSSATPKEISKLQPDVLFPFKDFIQGIKEFLNGGNSPPCILFFCLGEKWPDPENRPWVKKLITVEVVLTSMQLLKDMAVEGGASSLQSVELQMSLDEMMDLY